jgi:hypothetical protein
MSKHTKRIRRYCSAAEKHFGATLVSIRSANGGPELIVPTGQADKIASIISKTFGPITVSFKRDGETLGGLLFLFDPTSQPKEVLVDYASKLGGADRLNLSKALYSE